MCLENCFLDRTTTCPEVPLLSGTEHPIQNAPLVNTIDEDDLMNLIDDRTERPEVPLLSGTEHPIQNAPLRRIGRFADTTGMAATARLSCTWAS